jgi:carboxylesterase type B
VFEFASTGKPASEHAPRWADYTSARDETMVFGKAINAQAGFMKARLNLMLGGVKVLGPATKRK